MKKEKKVAPLIVDGELYSAKKYRKKINKKEEKEVKLPTKRFTIVDIILSLIGVLMVVYGIYGLINKNDTKEPKKQDNKVEEIDKFDYSKYVVLDINEYNIYTNDDINNMHNGLEVKNISNNAKLYLASRLCTIVDEDGITYIKENDMNNSVKKLFGDVTYNKESFVGNNKKYIYDQGTNRYIIETVDLVNTSSDKKYNVIKKEIKDNKIIYREYIAFTNYDESASFTIGNNKVDAIINKTTVNDHYQKLKYYEYEFIKLEDRYVLNKIRIK